jgi:competence protein ComEA
MLSIHLVPRQRLWALAAAFLIAACIVPDPRARAQETKTSPQEKTSSGRAIKRVDVNNADAATLETLPGIGPAMAERIIAGRPYKNLDDLGKVKGLSKSKLDALKNDVVFGMSTRARPAVAGETAKKPSKAAESKDRDATSPTTAQESKPTKASSAPVSANEHAASKLAPGEKININKASAEELDGLPGIGPTKAKAIVDYRTQNGEFKSIEDIEKVRGIKGGIFSKIRDHIKVD